MVSQLVRDLAERHGVTLSDRSVTGSHIWDGETLGTTYLAKLSCSYGRYCRCSSCSGTDGTEEKELEDGFLIHELAHFVVASVEQRTVAEYGLGWSESSFGALKLGATVDEKEAIRQEFAARKLEEEWSLEY